MAETMRARQTHSLPASSGNNDECSDVEEEEQQEEEEDEEEDERGDENEGSGRVNDEAAQPAALPEVRAKHQVTRKLF